MPKASRDGAREALKTPGAARTEFGATAPAAALRHPRKGRKAAPEDRSREAKHHGAPAAAADGLSEEEAVVGKKRTRYRNDNKHLGKKSRAGDSGERRLGARKSAELDGVRRALRSHPLIGWMFGGPKAEDLNRSHDKLLETLSLSRPAPVGPGQYSEHDARSLEQERRDWLARQRADLERLSRKTDKKEDRARETTPH